MTTTAKKTESKTLAEIVDGVSAAAVKKHTAALETAFDNRMSHEMHVAPANSSIQQKLKSGRNALTTPGIVALQVATNVDPDFVNRSSAGERRYNVYAVGKIADLLHGLNSGHLKNAINLCVVKSMFAFEKAQVPFTGRAAQAAASDKVKIEKGMGGLLTRHTVAAGTAPTQSSSTMNALMTLGIVKNTGTHRNPVFELTATPQTQALRNIVSA